ncbi:MAG TPA: response regulator [Myxococcota bacterium]|nr:response regulator [Myxococcota bacterium]HRY94315.1 response regulator [Myxococcota bacterium]HSA23314.1 response regulator [Myxococcota bacterium]
MTRILVVDDVKLFRHMEARVLSWRGYQIDEAASGAEALEKIRKNPPDLVLLDMFMPGMTGAEVCQQLKSDPALRSLPVILVTSSSRDEDLKQAVQAGCDELLTKPLQDATLVRKVEDLLGAGVKRRFPRVRTSMQVSFEDFKGIFFEYARDVSRTGVFIEMEHPLPVGARLKLSFGLPAPFHQPVVAYGRVVRQMPAADDKPGGVGVAFLHLDETSARVLDALVAGSYQPGLDEALGAFSRLSVQLEDGGPQPVREAEQAQTGLLRSECEELRTALDDLQREHLRLSAAVVLVDSLQAAVSPAEILTAARDALVNLLGAAAFGLFLCQDSPASRLLPVLGNGLVGAEADPLPREGLWEQALSSGQPQLGAPAREGLDAPRAAAPILDGERRLGAVVIHRLYPQKTSLGAADLQLLAALGRHLGRALVAAVARQRAGEIGARALLDSLG